MARLTLSIDLNPVDVKAAARDLEAVLERFGCIDPDDVPPHLRAAFDAEFDRITGNLVGCMMTCVAREK